MSIDVTLAVHDDRLVRHHVAPARPIPSLAEDVARGLGTRPRTLRPKYFYDEHGSHLFDRICETPEYYPTRTEDGLLAARARDIITQAQPDSILELGSGMSRKTRRLLDACVSEQLYPEYAAFDISEDALLIGGRDLLSEYSWLSISLLVGDYDGGFGNLPTHDGSRLFVFLGGTIGNFEHAEAVSFLTDLRGRMNMDDHLLIGVDRVKSADVLNAAYNDSAGYTAAFNLNMLKVINQELTADFDLNQFSHLAQYVADRERIEMHLVSAVAQDVEIGAIDARISLDQGERIRTEISRKFTENSVHELLTEAGFEMRALFSTPNQYFSLALAQPRSMLDAASS